MPDIIRIVHASDLHHHPTDAHKSADTKETPSFPDDIEVKRFWSSVRSVCKADTTDWLVFSGDVTLRGSAEGLTSFANHLVELRKGLGATPRVCVVPGNHDVEWEASGVPKTDSERGKAFRETVGNHTDLLAWWPDADKPWFERDDRQRLFLLALNSSMYCGKTEKLDERTRLALSAIGTIPNEAERDATLAWANRRLLHDAAYFDQDQLKAIESAVDEKCTLEASGPPWVRIVVLHHHLVPLPGGVPMEVKNFELTVNAGEVLDVLHRCDIDMVLHGHKHVPRNFIHTGPNGRQMAIVCAPTAGGVPVQSGNGFNAITIARAVDGLAIAVQRHELHGEPSTETLHLDRLDRNKAPRSWLHVHYRWRDEGYYELEPARALLDEVTAATIGGARSIQTASSTFSTRDLGDFPRFFEHIVDMIASARNTLHVACDYPAYGMFSAPDSYGRYRVALEEAARRRVQTSMLFLDPTGRRETLKRQFPSGAFRQVLVAPGIVEKFNRLNARLVSIGQPALDTRRVGVEEFRQAVEAVQQVEGAGFGRIDGIRTQHLRFMMPIHLWIADKSRAIFSIPSSVPPRNEEHGYWLGESGYSTADRNLVERLYRIFEYYDARWPHSRIRPDDPARARSRPRRSPGTR